MLTISSEARDIVRQIPSQPGQLPTGGLRIAAGSADGSSLHVGQSVEPRRGDVVVDVDGARFFLDTTARHRLEGRHLHVDTLPDGRLEFRTRPDAAA